jgi:hypothetical protein
MLSKFKLALIIIGGLVVLGGIGYGIYEAYGLYTRYQSVIADNTRLSENLTQAESFGKNAEQKLKDLNNEYSTLLARYDARVSAYSELYAAYVVLQTAQTHATGSIPDSTTDSVPCPPTGVCDQQTCLPLFKEEQVRFDWADQRLDLGIELKRLDLNVWNAKIQYLLHQKFKLVLIETTDNKTGAKNLNAELTEIDDAGSDIGRLTITEFKYVSEDNLKLGMHWWKPSLHLGIQQPLWSQSNWYPKPSLVFFTSAWQKNADVDLFNFFGVGLAVDTQGWMMFSFTPVAYNIGEPIPLINDLWIGLLFGVDLKAQMTVGISLSTKL